MVDDTPNDPRRLARLEIPRSALIEFIDSAIDRGRTLEQAAAEVESPERYREWTHETERWDAFTRDGLRRAYTTAGPSDEFYEAATGAIFRFIDQTDAQTLEYRREGIES